MENSILNTFINKINTVLTDSSHGIKLENEKELDQEIRAPIFYEEPGKKIDFTKRYDLTELYKGKVGKLTVAKERNIGIIEYETGILGTVKNPTGKYEILDIHLWKPLLLESGQINKSIIKLEKIINGTTSELNRRDYRKTKIPFHYKGTDTIKEIPTEWFL